MVLFALFLSILVVANFTSDFSITVPPKLFCIINFSPLLSWKSSPIYSFQHFFTSIILIPSWEFIYPAEKQFFFPLISLIFYVNIYFICVFICLISGYFLFSYSSFACLHLSPSVLYSLIYPVRFFFFFLVLFAVSPSLGREIHLSSTSFSLHLSLYIISFH